LLILGSIPIPIPTNTWLRKRRDAIQGMTQDALAAAVQLDKRAIGRLERCEPGALERPPYDRLAKALEVSVVALADDHARDLRALGQHERAEHARKVAAEAWQRQRFSRSTPASWSRPWPPARAPV
jgi:transcriptional regulator with XRE-family HTH domain